MTYSAYSVRLDTGGWGLCIFLDEFETPEDAQEFLRSLMEPYSDAAPGTIH